MPRETITRRQKDISRALRERRHIPKGFYRKAKGVLKGISVKDLIEARRKER